MIFGGMVDITCFSFSLLFPLASTISTSVRLGLSFARSVRFTSFSLFALSLLSHCFILYSLSRAAKPRREASLDRHTANPRHSAALLSSTSKQHLKFWHFREDGSSPLYCARTFLLVARTRVPLADSLGTAAHFFEVSFLFLSFLKFFLAEHSSLSCFVQGGTLASYTRDPAGEFPKKCLHKLFIVNKLTTKFTSRCVPCSVNMLY